MGYEYVSATSAETGSVFASAAAASSDFASAAMLLRVLAGDAEARAE